VRHFGLALAPGPRVVGIEAVRARLDDVGDVRAERFVDAREHRAATAVLDGIV
jgi:hypothetical protein